LGGFHFGEFYFGDFHFDEFHFDEFHFDEFHFDEFHFGEFHFDEFHFDEFHFDEFLFVELTLDTQISKNVLTDFDANLRKKTRHARKKMEENQTNKIRKTGRNKRLQTELF